jgi:hypothetical protein
MKKSTTGLIITLGTTILLSTTSLVNAQISPKIRDSQILPYLLENPQNNSLLRVRCLSQASQEIDSHRRVIRDSLLQSHEDNHHTITVEIQGSCRQVNIFVQDESEVFAPSIYYPAEFNNNWLNRQGSGWYWLQHHR